MALNQAATVQNFISTGERQVKSMLKEHGQRLSQYIILLSSLNLQNKINGMA